MGSSVHMYGEVGSPRQKPKVWSWVVLGLVMAAAVLGYGGYRVFNRVTEYRVIANQAAERFHRQFDAGKTDEIIADAAPGFREAGKPEEIKATLDGLREKLGTFKSGKQTYIQWNAQTGVGTTLLVRFDSEFTSGPAREDFTLLLKDGGARLYGYHVTSAALSKK